MYGASASEAFQAGAARWDLPMRLENEDADPSATT
jgi:hypothetical protein